MHLQPIELKQLLYATAAVAVKATPKLLFSGVSYISSQAWTGAKSTLVVTSLKYTTGTVWWAIRSAVTVILPMETIKVFTSLLTISGTIIYGGSALSTMKSYATSAISSIPFGAGDALLETLGEATAQGTVILQESGKEVGKNLAQGFFLGVADVFYNSAIWLKDKAIEGTQYAISDTSAQTWGLIAGGLAAYGVYRFSGRVIDETISYCAAVAKEAIKAPFTNIQTKRNIPVLTPLVNLCAKAYKKVFPPEPSVKPILPSSVNTLVNSIAYSMRNWKKHKANFQNLIIEGPPGTGKTKLARWLTKKAKFNFVRLSGADLAAYISTGKHLSALNKYIRFCKNSYYPTVLYVDEADRFCAKRETLGKGERQLLTAFLEATGDQADSKNMMIVLTTNRIADLDPAVLDRMDHQIHLGLPKAKERFGILKEHVNAAFHDKPEVHGCLNDASLAAIAAKTSNLSGRALSKLVNSLKALRASQEDNRLSADLVDWEVHRFVWKERMTPGAIRSWRIIELVGDFWHFTLPSLFRKMSAASKSMKEWVWKIETPPPPPKGFIAQILENAEKNH